MRKTHLIIIVLLLAAFTAHSQYITDINGHDWLKFDENARLFIIIGMCLNNYTTGQMLVNHGVLDVEQWESYSLKVSDAIIASQEMTLFYVKTQRLDYPVYVVAYIRNEWKHRDAKNFPSWAERKGGWQ